MYRACASFSTRSDARSSCVPHVSPRWEVKTSTPSGTCSFRDVAYGQIPRMGRARKHRAAAEWIAHKAGDRAVDKADIMAFHYEQAFELARVSGEDPEEVRETACSVARSCGGSRLRARYAEGGRVFRQGPRPTVAGRSGTASRPPQGPERCVGRGNPAPARACC